MVPPEYYFKIIDYLDESKLPATVSLTTNLWDYYKRPDRWIPLFKNPRVGIATSFQYGEGRRITKDQVLTEEIFIDIVSKFKKDIGYMPEFITVIDEENEDTVLDTVRLARRLETRCKINYVNASGRQTNSYPLSKMYVKYLEIYEAELAEYEFSTSQMMKVLNHKETVCPLSRDCDSHIRSLNPDGSYFSCGSFADDKLFPINFDREMKETSVIKTPLSSATELESLKDECFSCPMFNICNGCRKSIYDLKKQGQEIVEDHCSRMKSIAPKILKYTEAAWIH